MFENNNNGQNGSQNGNGSNGTNGSNGQLGSRKIWAVAGGKGGSGKSVMTSNIGVGLAMLGYRVILVDGDLGGANLHTCLNIRRPAYSLSDFLSNRVPTLEDVLLDTPNHNLKLISGGGEMIGMANLQYQRKMKLLRHLGKLSADYILVDLGAGTSYNTLDFFAMASQGMIVCNPEPNAKLDAYSFLKNVVFRKMVNHVRGQAEIKKIVESMSVPDEHQIFSGKTIIQMVRRNWPDIATSMEHMLENFSPYLIMNKIRRRSQISEAHSILSLAKEFLGISMRYLGHVEVDSKVQDASERIMPFLLEFPKCQAAKDVHQLITNLGVHASNGTNAPTLRRFRKDMKVESKHWA
jgi:flagellar biosynthesis protein FlhG